MSEKRESESHGWELGNLTRNEKIKDFILLFVLTYFLTRHLTWEAITIMFTTVFGFHYLHNLTYDEEPMPGFNHLHLKYFVATYLLCVFYLQAYKWWKAEAGELRPVKRARLQTDSDALKGGFNYTAEVTKEADDAEEN